MKAKLLLILLLAGMLAGCQEDTYNTADRRLFRTFDAIMGQLNRAISNEYNKTGLDLEGVYIIISGDSVLISKTSDTEYKLTTENSKKSTLDLTAELTDHIIWEYDNSEMYSFVVNGEGSYKITEDSTLVYKITDLGVCLNRTADHYVYFIYNHGGEITLSLNANNKKQTYHYTNSGGRIRCRETSNLMRSYDD